MRVLRHFSVNEEILERFDFKRELSMEAYLAENPSILELEDPFVDVNIIAEELTLKQGRKSKDTDGRIDLLVTYAAEYIGVIELKIGRLEEKHLDQLEDYLECKKKILKEYPDVFNSEVATTPKWIGVMVGNTIDPELAKKITDGYLTKDGEIPIAALTIQRFRSESGNVYIATESYFKNTGSNRDTSKYIFNDRAYGKGRLVLEVLKAYVEQYPESTYSDLEKRFPRQCQGSSGVFSTLEEASEILATTNRTRHFLKPNEIIGLADTKIAVSTQWGIGNIDKLISKAKLQGFKITKK